MKDYPSAIQEPATRDDNYSPRKSGHIIAYARVAIVVLESIPLRIIQDLGEEAMRIVYDASDSAVDRSEVVDVSQ
jgi:hypothetical protein